MPIDLVFKTGHSDESILHFALRAKKSLIKQDTLDMRSQIIDTAKSTGGLHIWLNVFKDDLDMQRRLNNGTKV